MITIEAVAQAEVVAVELGPGEVGEAVDRMVGQGREEEAGTVGTMMTAPMEVPVAVRDVAVVAVAGLEGDEEVHHRHHPPGHRPPQMTY